MSFNMDGRIKEYVYYYDTVTETPARVNHFWSAVNLWIERPNLLNKRLLGCELLSRFEVLDNGIVNDIISLLKSTFFKDEITSFDVNDSLMRIFKDRVKLIKDHHEKGDYLVFIVRKFIPKTPNDSQKYSKIDICILDYNNATASFITNVGGLYADIPEQPRDNQRIFFSYRISHQQMLAKSVKDSPKLLEEPLNNIALSLGVEPESDSKWNHMHLCNSMRNWLKDTFLPRIVKWANGLRDDQIAMGLIRGSLNLLDMYEYCNLYSRLKNVYGKKIAEVWPESTDPQKFVYEDVAIATYLLLLWGDTKQTFVDLGCGNGLLVHILTSEGHNGLGVDVRSRKIWDMYPTGTANLQVKTVAPTSDDSCLYPEADWLIGNHSDELTPWLPVLASLSSYRCKFFLLPCCSYELNGQKYQRKNSSKSQYMDYIDHIEELADTCGFNVKTDKLRIPSTRRICLIGDSRSYDLEKHEDMVKSVRDLVASNCSSAVQNDEEANCIAYDKFKARPSEIKVRNCTQLSQSFLFDLLFIISNILLTPREDVEPQVKPGWNEGTPRTLSELADALPDEFKKPLKNECGGLQTVLRNHRYIFMIDDGLVKFRKPALSDQRKKNCLKTKLCWFHLHHPNRCPLQADDCPYLHVSDTELTKE